MLEQIVIILSSCFSIMRFEPKCIDLVKFEPSFTKCIDLVKMCSITLAHTVL